MRKPSLWSYKDNIAETIPRNYIYRLLIESSYTGGETPLLNRVWVSKQGLTSSTDRIKQLIDDKKELCGIVSSGIIELFIYSL